MALLFGRDLFPDRNQFLMDFCFRREENTDPDYGHDGISNISNLNPATAVRKGSTSAMQMVLIAAGFSSGMAFDNQMGRAAWDLQNNCTRFCE